MKTFRKIISLGGAAAVALMVANTASAAITQTVLAAGVGNATAPGAALLQNFNGPAPYAGYTGGSTQMGTLLGFTADPPGTDGSYYSVQANPNNGPGVLTLASPNTFFGLYWGSVDAYNTLSFTTNMGVVSYTGTNALAWINAASAPGACAGVPAGDQGSGCTNRYIEFSFTGGQTYTSVSFMSTANAFESDNHAIAVPEPGSLALFGAGLLGMWMAVRRRKSVLETNTGFSAA